MRLCGMLAARGQKVGFDQLAPRATQIAVGELLAVLVTVARYSQLLANTDLIRFIDNLGVILTILKGSSTVMDLGSLAYALHLALHGLSARAWFEHVASWSNPSDGGSRIGVADPVARRLGFELVHIESINLPANFPRVSMADWNRWLQSQRE